MSDFPPIHTSHLFPKLDNLLLALLKSLQPEDWNRPTPAPQWCVKDVATHLLDGNLRTLSMVRDGYFGHPPGNFESYADLVKFLNQLNADFITAFKRVSPAVLVELLESTGKQFAEVMASLPPDAPALFSVAWAGQTVSPNWFHIAREYTEKWHHQQQIRAALGLEQPLYARELYHPYVQVSMYALPYHFREVPGNPNDCLKITIEGDGGGTWYLKYEDPDWNLVTVEAENPSAEIIMNEDIAWRIFMNAAPFEEARQKVTITGREELGLTLFGVRAVMV